MASEKHSKEFFELIRSIGEAKSKMEEDAIIEDEVFRLKAILGSKDIRENRKKEYMIRALYCEMLGHDASFAYIHALNLTAGTGSLMTKAVGYLIVTLCLSPDSELILLLVASLLRDMESSNFMENCIALTAVRKLVNRETIPALLPTIIKLLSHSHEFVRKKAVLALHAFYRVDNSCISDPDLVRRVFCDSNPSVMAASLGIFTEIASKHPESNKDMVPNFVDILKQILSNRLPSTFEYHRVSAPWVQIALLRVLQILGKDDPRTSGLMYDVLNAQLDKMEGNSSISHAVVFECIRVCTVIHPNDALLKKCAHFVSRFLLSDFPNIKYLGIKALTCLVNVSPSFAAEHQQKVIDCLNSSDDTLKRKTVDLLYGMTNPSNLKVVISKMIDFLKSSSDEVLRTDLMRKIFDLSERFAQDNKWYVDTMNTVFLECGALVKTTDVQSLLRLVAEGSGDEEEDDEVRAYAVDAYYAMIEGQKLTDALIQSIAWILGEFGFMSNEHEEDVLLQGLCDLMNRRVADPDVRGWIITAMAKICSRLGEVPEEVEEVLDQYEDSRSVIVQQKCKEIQALAKDMELLAIIFPEEGVSQELEFDADLGFLKKYVDRSLRHGAKAYNPHGADIQAPAAASNSSGKPSGARLLIGPYETPTKKKSTADPFQLGSSGAEFSSPALTHSSSGVEPSPVTRPRGNKKGRWTRDGLQDPAATQASSNWGSPIPTSHHANVSPPRDSKRGASEVPSAPPSKVSQEMSSLFAGLTTTETPGRSKGSSSSGGRSRSSGKKAGSASKKTPTKPPTPPSLSSSEDEGMEPQPTPEPARVKKGKGGKKTGGSSRKSSSGEKAAAAPADDFFDFLASTPKKAPVKASSDDPLADLFGTPASESKRVKSSKHDSAGDEESPPVSKKGSKKGGRSRGKASKREETPSSEEEVKEEEEVEEEKVGKKSGSSRKKSGKRSKHGEDQDRKDSKKGTSSRKGERRGRRGGGEESSGEEQEEKQMGKGKQGASDFVGDFFGGGSSSKNGGSASKPKDDFFGESPTSSPSHSRGPSGSGSSSAAAAAAADFFGLEMSAVDEECGPHQKCFNRNRFVSSDDATQVEYNMILKPSETLVLIYVTNTTMSVISNISVALQLPSRLTTRVVVDPAPSRSKSNIFSFDGLRSRGVITLCVVTTPGGPTGADAVGGPVRGHVSYISEGGQHTNNYSILVTPNDLLRGVEKTVNQYGAMWKSLRNEKKCQIPRTQFSSVQALASQLQGLVNLHCVSIINSESIWYGEIIEQEESAVLLHVRLSPNSSVTLTVRSGNDVLSDRMVECLEKLLI